MPMAKDVSLLLFSFLIFTGSPSANAEEHGSLPADVAKFVERRELCDHFRGEDPYDEERRRFLAMRLNDTCRGTDKELAGLKGKYQGNSPAMKILEQYEPAIEAAQ